MASILDRYGIKEVADVTFYELDGNGNPTNPVLYLDTLKVSTIEQTAESSDATGGKGNSPLISWDFGKEITVTLEDALFSAKSMAIMFGNGQVKSYTGSEAYIMKTEIFTATDTAVPVEGADASGWKYRYEGPDGKLYTKINPKFYDAAGAMATALENGKKYFCVFDILVDGSIIEVGANTFPGTYYVTGDTFARSEASGKDEFFQFIVPKAKIQSENTITLEAEGDPSVFNMNLKVLRPADGKMLKLVQYNALNGSEVTDSAAGSIPHNHMLLPTSKDVALRFGGDSEKVSFPGVATYTTVPSNVGSLATISTDVNEGTVTIAPKTSGTDGTFEISVKDASGKVIGDINVKVTNA